MQTDLYTKAVLTVIAIALSAIALQHAIPSAFAQNNSAIKVILCESTYGNCARIGGSGSLYVEAH